MKWLQTGALLLVSAGLAMGCGPAPEPETPRSGTDGDSKLGDASGKTLADNKGDTSSPTGGSVNIDDRILKTCGNLPKPRFSFDSAKIQGEADDILTKVGQCFIDGPLKGRELKLVGRADPRGTEMYNIALGQDRAASVARFLIKVGIPEGKIRSMSKGAMDATGTDEEGWARDRRVDILLVD